MRNVPHRLLYLNTGSLVGGAAGRSYGIFGVFSLVEGSLLLGVVFAGLEALPISCPISAS